MSMKHLLTGLGLAAFAATQAHAVEVNYFLSPFGLTDPSNDQSPAVDPQVTSDPVFVPSLPGEVTRLYLWADLSPLGVTVLTDLKGIDLAFSVNGSLQITRTNLWQRTIDDGGTPEDPTDDLNRWASAPGLQTWNSQSVNLAPAVAVLEPGLTTRSATITLDEQARPGNNWLFGWIEVVGNLGEVQILNNASGFLQGTGLTNRVFLGLDDTTGGPAEIPGAPVSYSNPSWEAATPEPGSLALLALSALVLRRR